LETAMVALPLPSVTVPSVVVPSLKVTVPVALEGVTLAVRVTGFPALAGFGEAERVKVVVPCPTATGAAADVLPPNLLSPP